MICPEELPRSVRTPSAPRCGVRNMPITRTDTAHLA